ncbi:MAG TPA: valine--tRNA ligase [Clostridiales bacterium]|nr:valine--tRNA ligase [Clostridiales bacterium]
MSEFSMEKTYNPQAIEQSTYQNWEESGAFVAKRVPGKKPYTIVMPPPNITGELHMGHAMDCVLQDALTRYHRMIGDPTLWLPGTDHASIATEVKIVESMAQEGLTKDDLGREKFLERAWAWKNKYGNRITTQLRRLGASCDWSRERFTMDEGCSRAVREVFVRLYEQGLIYRGDRIINWCPSCLTAISDAEIEYEEQASHIWHIRYPAKDGGEGIVVATTRPETMLGDTGVAVHPEDERYKNLVGKEVILPIANRAIPVVADNYVDKEFGTGAVKMTPAHDPNDFEIAKRHNLEILRVMNDDATMNEHAGAKFQGMDHMTCRQEVVKELKELGLLLKVENYTHNVGTCYRCDTTVEPMLSEQWFVKMKPLAEPAIQAVKEGKTRFLPDRFSKIYFNWMENVHDWCISRQLWWGHRIPCWYCEDCDELIVSREDPTECPKCKSVNIHQDEDVLDTWFSSALWPFSTLGWPDETEDLKYFYPTSTLVTGYDIIFFWVARMIFSGIAHMGEVPFDTVLIHGLVRAADGRKMSKSLGNGIDPLEIIDEYGADALRFSLCMGISPGNDTRFSQEKIEAARNFANKVWNAARFVLMNLEGEESLVGKTLEQADSWILTRCMSAVQDVTNYFELNDHGLAAQRLYDFAWSDFCDWYIELAKADLFGDNSERKRTVQAVLQYVLKALLKMLHPFMPFLTETLYRYLPGQESASCMLSAWPTREESFIDEKAAEEMEAVMELIRQVRNLRSEMKVQAGRRTRLIIKPAQGYVETFSWAEGYFKRLAYAQSVEILLGDEKVEEKTVSVVTDKFQVLIPLGDLVDLDEELARLNKEKDNLTSEITRSEGKLNNAGFVNKAPEKLVELEREKLIKNKAALQVLVKRIEDLQA